MRVGSSLLLAAALSLIAPVISSSLLPRSPVCGNDGKTKAGSLYQRRDLSVNSPSLNPRAIYNIPISWCAPGTQTWVTITVFNAYGHNSDGDLRVLEMLTATLTLIQRQLANGDRVIPRGTFSFSQFGASWYSANANNHQQTWGVLAGAVMALASFMDAYGSFGYAHFQIFDGGNQVGSGSVGPG